MLLIATVVAVLSVIGFALVTVVALYAMKRLGLQVWNVLMWFGLADAPPAHTPRLAAVPDGLRRRPATRVSRRSAAAPGT